MTRIGLMLSLAPACSPADRGQKDDSEKVDSDGGGPGWSPPRPGRGPRPAGDRALIRVISFGDDSDGGDRP